MAKLNTCVAAAAIAAALVGCGGGSDDGFGVEGLYAVTRHTENEAGCDAEGPELGDYTHFQLVADEIFGQPFLSFGECQSADPASCDDGGLFSAFFKEGGELVTQISASSGGGDVTCFLTFVRGTLEGDGDTVLIEIRSFGEEDDTLSEVECAPDTAEARGESMACERYEVIAGTLVP